MALFQRPPQNAAEFEASRPLDLAPDQIADIDEATWYAKVYRGDDVPQLTVRAVLMGSFLGFFLAFTNLYIGLKTGWHLGVAITACILSYVISNLLVSTGVQKTPLTILETNAMASTASSAGYSTGGTMVSAIAALLMLSATDANPKGEHLPVPVLVAWTFCLAVLGTVMAIPMKRNMINQERLRFPSGLASAVTLQSLFAAGDEALRKGRALLYAMAAGAVVPLLLDVKWVKPLEGEREPLLPAESHAFDFLPSFGGKLAEDGTFTAFKPSDWTVMLPHNPVMLAAGMLIGLRATLWMFVGAVLLAWVVGPYGYEQAWDNPITGKEMLAVSHPGKAWRELGLWFGVPIMVSSSILAFLFQWRTIVRAFTGFGGGGADADPRVAATEVPMSWFVGGTALSGLGVVLVAQLYFEVPMIYGALAVVMTFALALVAARATGETDVTPTGAMGKIMQLTYGVLIPQSTTANLMTAGITAGAASSSADLLNDLKSGYLLGANPRRQFIAQASGIFTGTIATTIGFYLLVPDATALTGAEGKKAAFAAPAAQAWKAVAELFKNGIEAMHPVHRKALIYGAIVGAILVILETMLPKFKKYLPSAAGLGLGFILPFPDPFMMFVGAVIAAIWTRSEPRSAESYLVPISAGLIAGISIVGVIANILNNLVLTG